MKNVEVIKSKSDAHRAIICNGLSDNPCEISIKESSKDIDATLMCMKEIRKARGLGVTRPSADGLENICKLKCGESGSTFRFLIPLVAALGISSDFFPEGRLKDRPLSPLYEELISHGVTLSEEGSVPFEVRGKLKAGAFSLPGNVSSQFFSGLLFALPLLDEDSTVSVIGELESIGYVKMTMATMAKFGVHVDFKDNVFYIKGAQKYIAPSNYKVEGDWSNAAFFVASGILGEEDILCTGLDPESIQGDKEIYHLSRRFGANVFYTTSGLKASPSRNKLVGISVDARNIPDMVPTLALLGAISRGRTEISGAERLRIKESDRLKSISTVLNILGAEVYEKSDGLEIIGKPKLQGGRVYCFNDHRIVMMAAVASLVCWDKVVLDGWRAVEKSYPNFFEKFEELGLCGNLELGRE